MESDNRSDNENVAPNHSGGGEAGTSSAANGSGSSMPAPGAPGPLRPALSGNSGDGPQCARTGVWTRPSREIPDDYHHEVRSAINPQARGRLRRELIQFTRHPPQDCRVKSVGGNYFEWDATVLGPRNTPYEGGVFKLKMYFPLAYPFVPPEVRFQTKIYHLNVSPNGKIYLELLRKDWSPVLTVEDILHAVLSILVTPNTEAPLEDSIAKLYKSHRLLHDNNARVWTIRHAKTDDAAPADTT